MFKPMVFGRYGLLIYFLIIFYVIYHYYGRYPVTYKPAIGHCNEPRKDFCSDSLIPHVHQSQCNQCIIIVIIIIIIIIITYLLQQYCHKNTAYYTQMLQTEIKLINVIGTYTTIQVYLYYELR